METHNKINMEKKEKLEDIYNNIKTANPEYMGKLESFQLALKYLSQAESFCLIVHNKENEKRPVEILIHSDRGKENRIAGTSLLYLTKVVEELINV